MADLFSVLSADHDRILRLVRELTGGPADPAAGPEQRKAIAGRLVQELSRHEVAEEIVFWPLVRHRLADGEPMAEVALSQEAEGKRLLNELVHVSPGNEKFAALTHRVAAHLREHITYEQHVVWPKLELKLAREERDELGAKLERIERVAPVRPHPHVPADPRLLKTVGPAAALLDRARNLPHRG